MNKLPRWKKTRGWSLDDMYVRELGKNVYMTVWEYKGMVHEYSWGGRVRFDEATFVEIHRKSKLIAMRDITKIYRKLVPIFTSNKGS